MKITKSGKRIGGETEWLEDVYEEPMAPDAVPVLQQMDIHIERFGARMWSVWVNDDLLIVTAYEGANAVKELVGELATALAKAEEKVYAVGHDGSSRGQYEGS